jgi:hypothetical protein
VREPANRLSVPAFYHEVRELTLVFPGREPHEVFSPCFVWLVECNICSILGLGVTGNFNHKKPKAVIKPPFYRSVGEAKDTIFNTLCGLFYFAGESSWFQACGWGRYGGEPP